MDKETARVHNAREIIIINVWITARVHNAREIIIINVWIRRQRGCITQGKLS